MCNTKCCWDNVNYPFTEQMEPLLEKNYYNDVSRSPDCNWDMFENCRAQYMVDFNYYNRYTCVVASGCVSWSTFSLRNG